ncbi:membrane protein [Paraliobacillus quinghaiensis]|uniref:Membrane protein n=1 Tax=Paraliobacillus quinghaiensis TaxID=470815 RepID=A0A917TLE9_9BACI|nr:YeiH family protein [Paraliobacillus quinghaiensis]GGM27670.1 membrane protein [Paraliobacillus quinghaiensis]
MEEQNKYKWIGFIQGIGITLLLAIVARYLANLPFLSILGSLVLAILLGITWKYLVGKQDAMQVGIAFSNKKLLRVGIILLGMRLNLADIYNAGLGVFGLAVIQVLFALVVVYGLTRLFGVKKRLGILAACGTAICGAAAVVAIAPQIKANDDETAVGAATVAILGTIFTLVYTLIYGLLGLTPEAYGIFTGSTLHEVAHVIAAADIGGVEAVDLAVIVKLTRVALLVPVALLIGFFIRKADGTQEGAKQSFSFSIIPWFILGFLAMSGFNTLGIVSENIAMVIVDIAYLLIGMAMAGLGLNVDVKTFRKWGLKSFSAALIGSVLLSVLGYTLIRLFGLG